MDANCPLCLKLTQNADVVWRFGQSIAYLGPWQYYAGYCVLVHRSHTRELFDLAPEARRFYLDEMTLLAQAIHSVFQPGKMNYEMLGNQVPHMHWHLFSRSPDDPDARQAVWLALDRAERDPAEKLRLQTGPLARSETIDRLRSWLVGRTPEEST